MKISNNTVCGKNIKVIKSLKEYQQYVDRNDLSNLCYFRGESRKYGRIVASAFRQYTNELKDQTRFLPFSEMLKDYRYEVSTEIDPTARKHFLYYAQHHGLPTQLIDISKNPNIALFFACSGSVEKELPSYVYCFNKNEMIDISKLVEKDNDNDLGMRGLFSPEFPKSVFHIYDELTKMETYHPEEFMNLFVSMCHTFAEDSKIYGEKELPIWSGLFDADSLLKETERYLKSNNKNVLEKSLARIIDNLSRGRLNFLVVDYRYKMRIQLKKKSVTSPEFLKPKSNEMEYGCTDLKLLLIVLCHFYIEVKVTETKLKTPEVAEEHYFLMNFPILACQSNVKFDRIGKQEGLFIYQASWSIIGEQGVYNQQYNPSLEFEIYNQKEILLELAKIGINDKTVFGDHDSIAKYLKYKYIYQK